MPSSATIKNVETINIFNDGGVFNTGTANTVDASKFVGATQVWQHGLAGDVSNLAATTTAGFKGIDNTTATAQTVSAATGVTSASIALDGAKGDSDGVAATVDNIFSLKVAGDALNSVNVSGALAKKDTATTAAAATLALAVTTGKDAEALTLNSAVATTLSVTESGTSAATKDVRTVDASASTGAITFDGTVSGGTAGSVSTIKTGTGADNITVVTATLKDDAATAAVNETVSALVETGAGNDKIFVNTTGAGTTTVSAGEGNDVVELQADGTGVLSVNLGAGDDTFNVNGGAVSATDVIDGGEGKDTLMLSSVGAANIGAFQNFEVFDTKGLGKALDVDILAAKNTVTEFVATGDVGATAALINVGAGVGYRITGDTDVANGLTLTQKAAGALTVTLDIDETAATAATTAATDRDATVVASNATSITAVFDSAFVDKATGNTDNATDLNITGSAATSLNVVSGGANAVNNLDYTSGNNSAADKGDVLTSVSISGDRAITVSITETDASEVTSIDASSLTGALTISTAELKASSAGAFDGGVLTLGSGADVVTITTGSTIAGFAKGTAEDASAQGAFDVVTIGSAVAQAADDVSTTDPVSVKDGKLTFNGAGPATLADAITAVDTQLATDGEAVVFEYVGDSYIFVQDGATDVVVKLTGVTGLNGLDEVGTSDNLYVF